MPKALITTIPFGEADPTSLRLLKEAGIDYLINPLGRKFNQSELQNYMKDINYIIAGTDQINAEVIKSSPQFTPLQEAVAAETFLQLSRHFSLPASIP